jgi:hypothetical protein
MCWTIYLRYGSIELPHSIPKTMFQRESDYFGIAAKDDTIKSPLPVFQCELNYYGITPQDYTEKHDMLAISAKCTYEFCRSDRNEMTFTLDRKDDELYDHYNTEIDSKDIEDYLGLTVKVAST